MKLDEVKQRVAAIYEIRGDDEVAHGKEDDLYHDFIKYVAESGNKRLREIAAEILKTEDIDFARWCA